ncbi:hypothetical protein [Novosphingobium mathurense]|uniref:AAA+ ATPase domain-containing protein n=1 Tax=Novosphingobium mathurense TaxID=428990 RepID=A0A1U6HZB4_9SPHN|nr:hypothetical protein [Novosphingobium mathurense]SLK01145.1 hypothetical protein SAMN06295987_103416 [Novosphingobium mathurense]
MVLRLIKLCLIGLMACLLLLPELAAGQQQAASIAGRQKSSDAVGKAQQIQDLMAGRLDPDVDVANLFSFSLTSSDAASAHAVAQLVTDGSFYAQAKADPSHLKTLAADQAKLALAQAAFLRLPQTERERLLEAQRKRYDSYRAKQKTNEAAAQELARLQRELQGLQDFLAGKPAPSAVLKLGLISNGSAGIDSRRLETLTGQAPFPGPEPAADAPIDERIAWLRKQIAAAKSEVLQLQPATLAQLEAASGVSSGTADEIASADALLDVAKSQLSDAARAAHNAASEQERLIANEQARLLRTKSVQAAFRAQLARAKAEPDSILESALSWRRRIQELGEKGQGRELQADSIYAELVPELTRIRQELRRALDTSENGRDRALEPGSLDPALPQDLPATRQLHTQKAELARAAVLLRASYGEELWAKRRALNDAMVLLNGERLALLSSLSASKRAQVTGFGAEGVAQVRREISEIVLELRFNLQSWRQTLGQVSQPFQRPTPEFVLALLRLFAIALVFSWWRRNGDPMLRRAQAEAQAKRPRTLASSLQAGFFEYWRRVRKPLDWLVLTILFRWLLPDDLVIPGLSFIWIVLFWSLTTVLVVNLVDQLARGRGRDDPRATLRWNSLRLIAGSLLAVGLLLNLTSASVGKGAMYNWVFTLALLLAPAILVLLTNWWRARIVALAQAEARDSSLLDWVSHDPGGFTGLLGRIAAGALLLLRGLRSIIARRMRDLALVRELFEQRARIQAARQVAEDKASGRFHRPSPEVLECLDPHRLPIEFRTGKDRPGGLALPELQPGTVTLVVGERGLGKSSFLRDLSGQYEDCGKVVRLSVGSPDLGALLRDLHAALGTGVKSPDPAELSGWLARADAPCLITVDDLQRLVIPAIGGLAAIDTLIAMARSSGINCRWAFTIGEDAWSFLQRARIDRVLFDAVIRLPHWSSADLRALIERRTAQVGLQPDFSAMIDDGVFELGEDLTVEERKKRGYFDRLAEYVNGNPAIALDYWRQSLFVDGLDQRVVVRTFDAPAVDRLAALPLPSLFVLRAIMRMDMADVPSIQASTDLSTSIVTDALRSLQLLGVIAPVAGYYQITLHWWMEATRLLLRQNLTVRGIK